MKTEEIVNRCSFAAEELDRHEDRHDGLRVIEGLCGGLTLVRDSVYSRIHTDVERRVGFDSMISPLSEEKTERTGKLEIEIYQIVVAAEAAYFRGYVAEEEWFREWLTQLRIGDRDVNSRTALRISYYASKAANERRLAFSNILDAAVPEARRSPLILLRLLPQAVQIATALAFGNTPDAEHWRREQKEILPSISDCHRCHGKLLENGEQCPMCGNPIWTYDWLTAADG